MIKYFTLFLFIAGSTIISSQSILNMELLSNVQFGEAGNDCWGFVDDNGIEYAVMGTRTATRIYSLEDPSNPIERYVVPGAAGTWRDIKYYEGFLYVTADQGADGLTIIDATGAPDNFSFTRWKPEIVAPNATDTLRRAHNIYIDTENGIGYIAGHNVSQRGVMIVDLKEDPNEPVVLSVIDEYYSHDAYVNDNKLYSSELGNGLAIYDVTDPSNPVEVTRQETSRDFCHNAWSTLDNNFVFTTDERSSAYLDAYDVSKDGEAILIDKYRPLETLEWPVIPHNTHILGDFAITSWYTDGVVITDISRPDNIIRVGQWDTYTGEGGLNPNGSWFEGAWGTYPYLPSGIVLVSDINTGLYIFGADYKNASWLEGTVTSANPFEINKAISGAKVELLGTQLAYDETKTSGEYKTGAAVEGSFRVAFSHPNYISDTFDIELIEGEVTILNAQLRSSYLTSKVLNTKGKGIENAKVVIQNVESGEIFEYTTNADGDAFAPIREGNIYQTYAAAWGYLHVIGEELTTIAGENSTEFILQEGYQDDFFADIGWKVTTMAGAGNWDRNPPIPTEFSGELSNPSDDISTDIGTFCWTTGNNGTGVGDDDVDDGVTTLESPFIKMASWESAKFSYHYWFFNAGGNNTPNDTLIIKLTNGSEEVILDKVTNSTGGWTSLIQHDITPSDITFTDEMQVVISAGDYLDGHLVEAAFDAFSVINTTPSSVNDAFTQSIALYPNPTSNKITLDFDVSINGNINIINAVGKLVHQEVINGNSLTISTEKLPAGQYYGKITTESETAVLPFIKI